MTMPTLSLHTCGTCKWFAYWDDGPEGMGDCYWPVNERLPASFKNFLKGNIGKYFVPVHRDDGKDCPCWEPRND